MKGKLARRAIKSTVKHSARRAASNLERKPMRTATILAVGAVVGLIIGVLVGRATGGGESELALADLSLTSEGNAQVGTSAQ